MGQIMHKLATLILAWCSLLGISLAADEPLPPEIKRLADQLADENVDKRDRAMEKLAELGQQREPARRVLIEALKSPDPRVREIGLRGLGLCGPAAKDAVDPVLHVLDNDSRPDNRHLAVQVLGKLGPAAAPATERLIEVARGGRGEGGLLPYLPTRRWQKPSWNQIVRADAIFSLGEIGSPDAVEFLVGVMRGAEPFIQNAGLQYYLRSAEALGKIGDDRPRVIQALERGQNLKLGGDNANRARQTADTALRRIRQKADK